MRELSFKDYLKCLKYDSKLVINMTSFENHTLVEDTITVSSTNLGMTIVGSIDSTINILKKHLNPDVSLKYSLRLNDEEKMHQLYKNIVDAKNLLLDWEFDLSQSNSNVFNFVSTLAQTKNPLYKWVIHVLSVRTWNDGVYSTPGTNEAINSFILNGSKILSEPFISEATYASDTF